VWGHAWVKAPGCDRLFQAVAQDRADYQGAVDQLLAGPFGEQTILKKIDRWSRFIHDSEVADPTVADESLWMSSVNELKNAVPVLRERLQAIRDGRPVPPLSLSLTSINNFETATSLGTRLAFAIRANVNSDVSQNVRTTGALDGHQDLLLKFVYRDPSELPDSGWRQWIYYFMPFTNGFGDLTSVPRLRLLLRTDRPRIVRIELESDRYQTSSKGTRFGWDVAVTSSPTLVDLTVAKASLPALPDGASDALDRVRAHVSGLIFNPAVVGRNASGHLGSGRADSGYLEVDDIQFFAQ
jgi:hypothetical protein